MDTQVQVKLIMSRSVKSGEKTKSCQGNLLDFLLNLIPFLSILRSETIRQNHSRQYLWYDENENVQVALDISLMIFLLPQFQLVKSFYDSNL